MAQIKLSLEQRKKLEYNMYTLATSIDIFGIEGEAYTLEYFKSLSDKELIEEEKRLLQREENLKVIKGYLIINDTIENMALLASSDEELTDAASKIRKYYEGLSKCIANLENHQLDKDDQLFIESLIKYQYKDDDSNNILADAKEEFLGQEEVESAYGNEDIIRLNLRYNTNIIITE